MKMSKVLLAAVVVLVGVCASVQGAILADAKKDFKLDTMYAFDATTVDPGFDIYGSRWYMADQSGTNVGTHTGAWVSTWGANIAGPNYMYGYGGFGTWSMFSSYPGWNQGRFIREGSDVDTERLIANTWDASLAAAGAESVDMRWISGVSGDVNVDWELLCPVGWGFQITATIVANTGSGAYIVDQLAAGDVLATGGTQLSVEPGDWVEIRVWTDQYNANVGHFNMTVAEVPEPATMMLLGLGAGLLRWRKK